MEVPSMDEFNRLVNQVKELTAEVAMLKKLLLTKRALSRTQAAKVLGVTTQTLYNYACSGKLKPQSNGGRPTYTMESLEEYLAKQNFSRIETERKLIMALEGEL